MAKRKTKKRISRRRRIGALALNPSSPLVKFGSIALGYFMGDKLNDAIEKATGGKVDGKIIAAGEVGAGVLLMQGKQSTAKAVLAGLLIGAGAKKGLVEFGVISGFRSVPVLGGYQVPALPDSSLGGYQEVPVLGGYNVPTQVLGGVDNEGGSGYTDHD